MSFFKNLFAKNNNEQNPDHQEDLNNEIPVEDIENSEPIVEESLSQDIEEDDSIDDTETFEAESSNNEPKKGIFAKLLSGLDKTRKNLLGSVDNVLSAFTSIDEELFDELEEALIMADIGVQTSSDIISAVKSRVKKERVNEVSKIKLFIQDEISSILKNDQELVITSPAVMLVIGVNGVGKTTTIGKLAHKYKSEGKEVILAAADTFRAAAIDQLEIWAERNSVPIIKHQENSDPAAVVFDGIKAAKTRGADILICDTAGRLHNKKNLMEELKKIGKIIEREFTGAQREILLVLDASTGQNALQQARMFKEAAGITGIILTKLDGTAKGGIIIAIKNELNVPVRYIGIGEKASDLEVFDAEAFSRALFNE